VEDFIPTPVDESLEWRDSREGSTGRERAEPARGAELAHTYASLMLAAGFKPYEVSRWMGHANVSTTDGKV